MTLFSTCEIRGCNEIYVFERKPDAPGSRSGFIEPWLSTADALRSGLSKGPEGAPKYMPPRFQIPDSRFQIPDVLILDRVCLFYLSL